MMVTINDVRSATGTAKKIPYSPNNQKELKSLELKQLIVLIKLKH